MKQLLVLGAGLIGARHAQAIKAHAGCNLVGVVEPNQSLYRDANTTYFSDIRSEEHTSELQSLE